MRAPDFLDFLIVAATVSTLGLGACRANVSGEERSNAAPAQTMPASFPPRAPATHPALPVAQTRTESAVDRAVHAELDHAFAQDANLKGQDISFTVDRGDIMLTGNVKTEKQREMANEVAMTVPGVRSVANALRVSQ
jgi:BON domain-containing protein